MSIQYAGYDQLAEEAFLFAHQMLPDTLPDNTHENNSKLFSLNSLITIYKQYKKSKH